MRPEMIFIHSSDAHRSNDLLFQPIFSEMTPLFQQLVIIAISISSLCLLTIIADKSLGKLTTNIHNG